MSAGAELIERLVLGRPNFIPFSFGIHTHAHAHTHTHTHTHTRTHTHAHTNTYKQSDKNLVIYSTKNTQKYF
jgi:ABC-type nickel/cobalt efflux system permease component RcnA